MLRNLMIVCGCVLLLMFGTSYAANSSSTSLFSKQINTWKTKQGVEVYFVRKTAVPMLDVSIIFNAGSTKDGKKHGLAVLTGNLINQGTAQLSADEIAKQFDNAGAEFSAGPGLDRTMLRLRTLVKPALLNANVALVNQIITEPSFPADAIARVKQQQLTILNVYADESDYQAELLLKKALFADQPYAYPEMGYKKTINAISRNDILSFYKKYYVARNAIISMVGDLTVAQAKEIANKLVDGLPEGKKAVDHPEKIVLTANDVSKPIKKYIHGKAQSTIIIAQPGLRFKDDRAFPLTLANAILGRSSTSLLFKKIRDGKGSTYGIYSSFEFHKMNGWFAIETKVPNADVSQVIKSSKSVLAGLVKSGLSQQQLDYAKTNYVTTFVFGGMKNSDLLRRLVNIAYYKLPLDFYDNFVKNIKRQSLNEVNKEFANFIQPNKTVTIIVGGKQ